MGLLDFFSRKSNETLARERMERELRSSTCDVKPLVQQFGRPIARLQEIFTLDIALPSSRLPHYPHIAYQGEKGVKAFVHWQHVEPDDFPHYLNAIHEGAVEVQADSLHYLRGALHSLVSYSDEFAGRNVFVLSNDVSLIERLAPPKFGPSPPWVFHYAEGPFMSCNQGAQEYWHRAIWLPFWSSLSVEDQSRYLARQREKTKAYICDDEWDDWVDAARRDDPRTHDEARRNT